MHASDGTTGQASRERVTSMAERRAAAVERWIAQGQSDAAGWPWAGGPLYARQAVIAHRAKQDASARLVAESEHAARTLAERDRRAAEWPVERIRAVMAGESWTTA